jgi:iron(III) transport system ATP-binding protein
MIAGFEIPTAGRIVISGTDVTNVPPNNRDSAMVFQNYAIFPHMNVAANVGFGLGLRGVSKAEIRRRVGEALAMVELEDLGERSPNQLSGGQQQRVALARAIINEPKLLLFDEPLSNLDARLREQMRRQIRHIQQQLGITALYVTHDQLEAMAISDLIVVMNKGRIEQAGTPQEIYTHPGSRLVADFIGSVNLVPGRVLEVGAEEMTIEVAGRSSSVPTMPGFSKGMSIELVLRPEVITINQPDGFLDGVIAETTYLGATVEYSVQVADTLVDVVQSAPAVHGLLAPGSAVKLGFAPEGVHLLAAG